MSRFPTFRCHTDEIRVAKRESVMETEQDKTLEAPQIAIQMKIDSQEYYLKASQFPPLG